MWRFALIAAIWAGQAVGQTSDRDYLTALLEDNLSGAGRQVLITGFEGALSSQAKMAEMTIADDAGVWLRLSGVVLDWRRSDLLTGRITINSLTAQEIDIARLPNPGTEISAEAPAFALPDLPVAINIGTIQAVKLRLGAPVLGEEVTASATAALTLVAGEGSGSFNLTRLDEDAPAGRADLRASFANAARTLDIDMQVFEGEGGLLARALGIPGAPELAFSVQGAGPLSDFLAQIDLRSDGVQRLSGQAHLTSAVQAGQATTTQFKADLRGDLAGLMQPEYRPFFGQSTALIANGQTRAGGGFDITDLSLTAQSMRITGSLAVAATGLPERFALSGALQDPSGAPLILPLTLDSPAAVASAQISATYDIAKGDSWDAALRLQQLDHADLRLARAEITAQGTLRDAGGRAEFTGDIALNAEGISPARAALSRAIGSVVWGQGKLAWTAGKGPLALTGFELGGEDYKIGLDGSLDGLASGLAFSGAVTATAQNLGRFSGILAQPLAGAGKLDFSGKTTLLSGAFDGVLRGEVTDLALGIAAADAMLAGTSTVQIDAARGENGIDLRQLKLRATGASLDISGRIAGKGTALSGQFDLPDMPRALRGFGGRISGQLAAQGALNDAVMTVQATAKGIDLGVPSLLPLTAGDAKFRAEMALVQMVPSLRNISLQSQALSVTATQNASNGFDLAAKLANLGAIVPQFPGALTVAGQAMPKLGGAELSLQIKGPAALSAQIRGFASASGTNSLRATGTADAGVMNAFIAPRSISGAAQFDLALRGAARIEALSGTIAVQGGQLADPNLPFALRNLTAKAALSTGQISLNASAQPTTGGALQIDGTVATVQPYNADLRIGLRGLGLRLADLLDGSVSGDLRLSGPLTGGAQVSGVLDLGRTEVQLKPTALATNSALPNLRHIGDTPAVAQTRARAGRGQTTAAAPNATPIALDITVRASKRVFVRGRGLDAELGGEVRLQGTSANVRPAGAFDLVQGRFEILNKRLTLEEVRLEMQGQLIPYLFVRATNVRGEVTTTVLIDGPVVDPEFRFSASPEMPEEEVLAQLLFDQNLTRLSALQAVQLASAIASLAGRGDGVLARTRKALKLDDLDVQTTSSGGAALKLGKYTSDSVYTELSIDGSGKQGLDFTYSLNEKIKLRAGAQTTGNTGIGIEFETNY